MACAACHRSTTTRRRCASTKTTAGSVEKGGCPNSRRSARESSRLLPISRSATSTVGSASADGEHCGDGLMGARCTRSRVRSVVDLYRPSRSALRAASGELGSAALRLRGLGRCLRGNAVPRCHRAKLAGRVGGPCARHRPVWPHVMGLSGARLSTHARRRAAAACAAPQAGGHGSQLPGGARLPDDVRDPRHLGQWSARHHRRARAVWRGARICQAAVAGLCG